MFVCTIMGATGLAYAEQATFKQQILPIDCVFETVNDGLGTLHYLTPAECGQQVDDPNDFIDIINQAATEQNNAIKNSGSNATNRYYLPGSLTEQLTSDTAGTDLAVNPTDRLTKLVGLEPTQTNKAIVVATISLIGVLMAVAVLVTL
jgi:hypothetical protein